LYVIKAAPAHAGMIQVVPKAPSFSNDCIRTSVVIQKTPDIMWASTICIRTCGGGDP